MDLKDKKILVTGAHGFLGKQVLKKLLERGVKEGDIFAPRSQECDFRNRTVCDNAVKGKDIVIHLAAKVGGLWYHVGRSGELFYDNTIMALNLIDASYRAGVKKFTGLGTVCEYPDLAPIPFKEDDLWNGYPSEITAPYGLSKRMMLVASQSYNVQYGFNAIHLLQINLYGPGDDFDPKSSHAIPALIRRVYEAKRDGKDFIEVWGDGTASREFFYVEDAAFGIILATERYDKPNPVNLGAGRTISIKNLVGLICKLMDYKGEIRWDISKAGGQLCRQLDVSLAEKEFGFKAETTFEDGLKKTINWFIDFIK
ncbi:MAG: NAD-dependent epimerase/dehydratase family protein [bacterium]|nr:NAD-dependent epimerase/dehydratase family protein [bacterium]